MAAEPELWSPALVTSAAAILVAIVSGVFAVASGRKKASADVQTVLNESFGRFVSELQEERADSRQVIISSEQRIEALLREREALERRIRVKADHIATLEGILRRRNITFPAMVGEPPKPLPSG